MARATCSLAVGIDRPHGERVDHVSFAAARRSATAVLAVLVHHEADGAAVHAVDRLAGSHEFVQGLQHQAVAAECDDDVGLLWRAHRRNGASRVSRGHDGLGARTGNKRDAIAAPWLMASHALARTVVGGGLSILPRRQPPEDIGMERAVFVYTTYRSRRLSRPRPPGMRW